MTFEEFCGYKVIRPENINQNVGVKGMVVSSDEDAYIVFNDKTLVNVYADTDDCGYPRIRVRSANPKSRSPFNCFYLPNYNLTPLGELLGVTEDMCRKFHEEYLKEMKEMEEERDYKAYLRLKEKFENNNN